MNTYKEAKYFFEYRLWTLDNIEHTGNGTTKTGTKLG